MTFSAKIYGFLPILMRGFKAFTYSSCVWLCLLLVLLLKKLPLFALIYAPVGVCEGPSSGKKPNSPFSSLGLHQPHLQH